MSLYAFENLALKLTELGYPDVETSSVRIMRRDLTSEERAGNLNFDVDGIYFTIDGQTYKGYMYLKFPDIIRYGLPKFHITNCATIDKQRANGSFDGRYFWHNSNVVSLEDRSTHQVFEEVELSLCGNCRQQAGVQEFTTTGGFFDLNYEEETTLNQDVEVDLFGYVLNWEKISRAYRQAKEYTCESCGLQITVAADKRFIQTHHRDGNKLNNAPLNLQCLCVLCHSQVDQRHEENFRRRRSQKEIENFVNKYREQLTA
ncbi:HNH endonuclease [Flaviaesturariibacter flavus]|uniref:HNH endonuclease n=1 Tax=Flaviaesturariibacter flavus TaxID=2502780 RepID=A0A4R1BIF6_9BACT|nr:HNH endonuclease signature motif containing protein [Flaviaesturariibacter flavus]TCJ17066.1 HNH endonuclease [Flaviaesturariibacter flavus]